MTNHDDKAKNLAVELELGLETHSGKLFRLGAFCLVALIFAALILVGGTFSKNASRGKVAVSNLSITTAGFEVRIDGYSGPDANDSFTFDRDDVKVDLTKDSNANDYNYQEDVCVFNIEGSGIPIYLDIVLDIEVEYALNTLKFYFFIDEEDKEEQVIAGEITDGDGESTYSITLDSTKIDGYENGIYNDGSTPISCLLVVDFSSNFDSTGSLVSIAENDIEIYVDVTVTATQAKEAQY